MRAQRVNRPQVLLLDDFHNRQGECPGDEVALRVASGVLTDDVGMSESQEKERQSLVERMEGYGERR